MGGPYLGLYRDSARGTGSFQRVCMDGCFFVLSSWASPNEEYHIFWRGMEGIAFMFGATAQTPDWQTVQIN